MGMFTELVLAAELANDLPEAVKDILTQITLQAPGEPNELPAHGFFKTKKWRHMLLSDSYSFAGKAHSRLTYDDLSKEYNLSVRCNLKNYEHEIELFLDWLTPYIATSGFLGYIRAEEATDPTLIYFKNEIVYTNA